MDAKTRLKNWRNSPDEAAAHLESQRILAAEQVIIDTLDSKTTDELLSLYFSSDVGPGVKLAIVVRGHAPYEAVVHALLSGQPLLAKVSCVHHKLLDEDLEKAIATNKWEHARREIERVLKRRREMGYTGPENGVRTNLAG